MLKILEMRYEWIERISIRGNYKHITHVTSEANIKIKSWAGGGWVHGEKSVHIMSTITKKLVSFLPLFQLQECW